MTAPALVTEIKDQVDRLNLEQQRQVLEFIHSLRTDRIRGVPGKNLLQFAGTIDPEDLEMMKQAIEEDCEKIDLNEW